MGIDMEQYLFLGFGFVFCFAGWHLFRFSVKILGFLIGANIGYAVSSSILTTVETPLPASWEPWVILCATIVFGAVGILLIKTAIKFIKLKRLFLHTIGSR